VIRRGKSGHFCDKALEGISHHAVVPNVNVLDDLEIRLARLSEDEKRLFALICRSYLAAVMPDYEYRQTVVTLPVPISESAADGEFAFAAGEVINERLDNPQRPHGVNVENCRPGFVIDIPSFLVRLARNARAVDEDIDGAVSNLRRCLLDAPRVRYVHVYNLDQAFRAFRQEPETIGRRWMAAGREDTPAIGRILFDEFESETAIRAGNHDGGH
jgi:hypothetical protein